MKSRFVEQMKNDIIFSKMYDAKQSKVKIVLFIVNGEVFG